VSLVWPVTVGKRAEPRQSSTLEQVLAEWHMGLPFRVYQAAFEVTCNDVLKLKMSGVTHVRFVYQDIELRVHDHLMELP